MAGIEINAGVINYGGVPLAGAGLLANRPAFGVTGRLYIGTDTNLIYRDTGSAWVSISGSGTITGSGTAGQAAFWSSGTAISGDNTFFWDNTNKRLGLGTTTPGVRLDVHGTGVIQQLNGTTTNNAFLDFQNAGTTQWRIGNNYNAAANDWQLVRVPSSVNALTIKNSGTFIFNSTSTNTLNADNFGDWDVYKVRNGFSFNSYFYSYNNAPTRGTGLWFHSTRGTSIGNYASTINTDTLFQIYGWGSSNSGFIQGGAIFIEQIGTVGTYAPSQFKIGLSTTSTPADGNFLFNVRSDGYSQFLTRLNVSGATDNSNFELNVNGNTYTGGLSPTILTVSTNTNMARTTTGYYVTATATLTLPTVSGLNNWYIVIAGTGATVTVQRNGTDTILDKTGASVTSVTVAANTRSMFYVGGGTITFQIF